MGRTLLAVLLVLAAGLLAVAWYVHGERRALDTPMALGERPFHLEVAPGSTLTDVAGELAARGALSRPGSLVWYARWQGLAHRIKAGQYRVEEGTTPIALLDLLVSGKVVQWRFTIVEGWTFAQLRAEVAASEHLVHTLQGASDEEVMARLGRPGVAPEGWFFPDTYHFPAGATDIELLARALGAMERKLETAWEQRAEDLPYRGPYQALVLASIVEKETGAPQERARIAGVFVRRLRIGMRLAADPTVIYGLGEGFDGNLRRRDLEADTPYNTYVRRGLPPTPIALPGGDAIDAALNPAPGKELFFVAKGDGSHHFSATFDEHEAAVDKYQRGPAKAQSGG